MFRTIKDFKEAWAEESNNTRKYLAAIDDESKNQKINDEHRDIGRIAWHIAMTLPEMGRQMQLDIEGPSDPNAPVPATVEEIRETYDKAATSLMNLLDDWTDETLTQVDDLYGEKWVRGKTLAIMLYHEIHHRGQMAVLMRQANVKVPGVYGPSKEEWAQYNASPPAV
jgi:uncharacterized damage-inducible protein DinB